MIKLFQFTPAFGLPNPSPFCMKLETYLRMANVPYQNMNGANLRRAPKGKFPYIDDDGRVVADSGLIVEYLRSKYGDVLDKHLTPFERAQALAFQRLIEEHLYWAVLHSRWIDETGWQLTRSVFFDVLPLPWRWLIPGVARRAMRNELHGHGMGRHTPEEIYALANADITALADFLGDKAFFMGEQPSSLDAVAYAFLANLLWVPLDTSMKAHAQSRTNLEAYCQRMKSRYYA